MSPRRPRTSFDARRPRVTATILALGTGAGNALNRMVRAGTIDATFIAANTDAQDMKRSAASVRFLLGQKLTKGLGASGDAETGRDAVGGDREALAAALNDAEIVTVVQRFAQLGAERDRLIY